MRLFDKSVDAMGAFVTIGSATMATYLAKPDWLASAEAGRDIDNAVLEIADRRPVMLINSAGERLMLAPDHWPQSIEHHRP